MNRAGLRIAWRDAARSKGRTALVVAMIGLPVMAVVAMAVLMRTSEWSPKESLPYEIGAADARFSGTGRGELQQDPYDDGGILGDAPRGGRPWTTGEFQRLVAAEYGPGARVAPLGTGKVAPVRAGRADVPADVTELDLRDPLAAGILRIERGRAPARPGEIALSASFEGRGIALGASVQVDRSGTAKRVVGFVRDPRSPRANLAVGLPGEFAGEGGAPQWLVKAGRAVTWSDVRKFNKLGLGVLSRAVVNHPPPASQVPPGASGGGPRVGEAGIVALAVAMIVLEVVLLTGPAFAVGVRRQRRQLALVAAAGGDERHVRAIVLAGGGILGAIAAIGGAVLGIAVAAAAVPVLDGFSGTGLGPFDVPWAAVLATPATGLLSGLAAAYVPARRAARMDVVAALAGRRDAGRTPRGWPIAGGVLVVAGLVLSLAGARRWHEYGAVAGAVAIIVGCVLLAPWTIGAAARTARYLPLPLRLAVRDGARNRGRSAPVVAAIMAAVAGITVLAIGGASDFEQRRREYEPRLPSGAAVVRPPDGRADEVGRAVRAEVPGVPLVEVRTLPEEGGACPGVPAEPCPFVAFSAANADAREITAQNVVGGAREARMLLGRDDPAVTSALNAGKVVLFGVRPPADGTVTAKVAVWEQDEEKTVRTVAGLPVAVLGGDSHVRAIVPPSVAQRIGLPARTALFGVDRAEHRVTEHEEGRIRDVVSRYSGSVYVERGFTESYGTVLLVLAVTGTVLALGGSLIATGLAAADARPDLATLAAIGARPRTRRLLTMGRAGFVAALGCWLGLAAGLVPGIAVARPLTMADADPDAGGAAPSGHGPIIDVPWPLLGLIGIAVPLAAMLAAGLLTRSRLPMARRITA